MNSAAGRTLKIMWRFSIIRAGMCSWKKNRMQFICAKLQFLNSSGFVKYLYFERGILLCMADATFFSVYKIDDAHQTQTRRFSWEWMTCKNKIIYDIEYGRDNEKINHHYDSLIKTSNSQPYGTICIHQNLIKIKKYFDGLNIAKLKRTHHFNYVENSRVA